MASTASVGGALVAPHYFPPLPSFGERLERELMGRNGENQHGILQPLSMFPITPLFGVIAQAVNVTFNIMAESIHHNWNSPVLEKCVHITAYLSSLPFLALSLVEMVTRIVFYALCQFARPISDRYDVSVWLFESFLTNTFLGMQHAVAVHNQSIKTLREGTSQTFEGCSVQNHVVLYLHQALQAAINGLDPQTRAAHSEIELDAPGYSLTRMIGNSPEALAWIMGPARQSIELAATLFDQIPTDVLFPSENRSLDESTIRATSLEPVQNLLRSILDRVKEHTHNETPDLRRNTAQCNQYLAASIIRRRALETIFFQAQNQVLVQKLQRLGLFNPPTITLVHLLVDPELERLSSKIARERAPEVMESRLKLLLTQHVLTLTEQQKAEAVAVMVELIHKSLNLIDHACKALGIIREQRTTVQALPASETRQQIENSREVLRIADH